MSSGNPTLDRACAPVCAERESSTIVKWNPPERAWKGLAPQCTQNVFHDCQVKTKTKFIYHCQGGHAERQLLKRNNKPWTKGWLKEAEDGRCKTQLSLQSRPATIKGENRQAGEEMNSCPAGAHALVEAYGLRRGDLWRRSPSSAPAASAARCAWRPFRCLMRRLWSQR